MQRKIHFLTIGIFAVVLCAASPQPCRAQLTATIAADRIEFLSGKPHAASGTGTVKNALGQTVASGALLVDDETMSLAGIKGSVFTYQVKATEPPSENWPTKEPATVAQVDFDGKDKWTLLDGQFQFMLLLGGNFRGMVLADNSLLRSSSIHFPEGTYSLWGYSITALTGGGTVLFKLGRAIDGDNVSIRTPEQKQLEYPHKAK